MRALSQVNILCTTLVAMFLANANPPLDAQKQAKDKLRAIISGIKHRETFVNSLRITYKKERVVDSKYLKSLETKQEGEFIPQFTRTSTEEVWMMKGHKVLHQVIQGYFEDSDGQKEETDPKVTAFDGKRFVSLVVTPPYRIGLVTISSSIPESYKTLIYLPAEYFGLYEVGEPLSQVLSEGDVRLVSEEKLDGVACYVVQKQSGPKQYARFWICPSRGFMSIRDAFYYDGKEYLSVAREGWKEVDAGVWFASKVVKRQIETTADKGSVKARTLSSQTIMLNKIEVNIDIPDSVFTIDSSTFKKGWEVIDLDSGSRYVVGEEVSDKDIIALASLAKRFVSGKISFRELEQRWTRKFALNRRLCGPYSLLYLCALYGVKANTEELSKLAGLDETGTSMKGLVDAGRAKGLNLVGVELSVYDLTRINKPAIVYVAPAHFVVFLRSTNNRLVVVEPPIQLINYRLSSFQRIVGGERVKAIFVRE